MKLPEEIKQNRKADHQIDPLILSRWSPRAMTGEDIPDDILMSLFEAGRWAPSAFNSQPWRFIYAKRDTKHWDTIFGVLVEFNQEWTKNASVLVVVISQKNFEYNGKPNPTGAFDTGAAWENIALQANAMGWRAHGMSGMDYDKAREVLGVPEDYNIHMAFAVGKKADKSVLSEEMQEKEVPGDRKPVGDLVMEGKFRT